MIFKDWLPVPEGEIPSAHLENLHRLFEKMLPLEEAFGSELHSTSAYRTLAHHQEIYRVKNEKRIQAGLKPLSVPMGSQHLYGNAVDIADFDKKLKLWVPDHLQLIIEEGLYMEAFEATPSWVHFQSVPSKSGHRFFNP